MDANIQQLSKWIDESQSIVFLGGAGVSTESGIPDFRSADGLYKQQYSHPPETIISADFFHSKPSIFFDFYRSKMLALDAQPNPAHLKLAQWEKEGKLQAVITQNIDGLHQAGGSENVLELHGSVHRNYCMQCKEFHPVDTVANSQNIPLCKCGGIIKPDVVLFQECLDDDVVERAVAHIRNADMLIIGGTSLAVYPAANLIHYYNGSKLVLVNKGTTPVDNHADLLINGPIGEIFSQL